MAGNYFLSWLEQRFWHTNTDPGKRASLPFSSHMLVWWTLKWGFRVKVEGLNKVNQGMVNITPLPQQSRYSPVRLRVLRVSPMVRNIKPEIKRIEKQGNKSWRKMKEWNCSMEKKSPKSNHCDETGSFFHLCVPSIYCSWDDANLALSGNCAEAPWRTK